MAISVSSSRPTITPAGAEFGPVGYELNLLYLVALLVLVVSPPSALSIDAWRARRRTPSRTPA